jgi:hypothetical protein
MGSTDLVSGCEQRIRQAAPYHFRDCTDKARRCFDNTAPPQLLLVDKI